MLLKPKYESLQVMSLAGNVTLDDVKAFMTEHGVTYEFAGLTPDNSFVIQLPNAERTLLLPREMVLVIPAPNMMFGADPRIVDVFYGPQPADS